MLKTTQHNSAPKSAKNIVFEEILSINYDCYFPINIKSTKEFKLKLEITKENLTNLILLAFLVKISQ